MAEAINALGNAVLAYVEEQRQEGRVDWAVPTQEIVDGIEIVLETRKLYDLMADKDAPRALELCRDGTGAMKFDGIPVYGVPRYAGNMIMARGYVKAMQR